MKKLKFFSVLIFVLFFLQQTFSQGFIINHTCTDLNSIPETAINQAKQNLHIAYGHTSHGSQLISGMSALVGQTTLNGYKGNIYQWNEGGTNGALDIDDYFVSGDLGHNGDITWATNTKVYLDNINHSDVNVVIWSWCGGVSDNTPTGIQTYLDKMNELEGDYPNIKFVYMTGHSDINADATLKANNQQIRDYCITNNKILYDFYDIESYNPDGTFFEFITDNCNYYDYSGNNPVLMGNWATEWQNSHTENVDWYNCSPAHTEALNGNLKAYAAWWLWCKLAGWDGATNIINFENNNDISISPNPTSDILRINTKSKIINLQIINCKGKIIKQNTNNTVDVSNLESGIYFIKIKTNNNTLTTKFIKNNQ